jgi:hypothetical protein
MCKCKREGFNAKIIKKMSMCKCKREGFQCKNNKKKCQQIDYLLWMVFTFKLQYIFGCRTTMISATRFIGSKTTMHQT